MLTKNITQLQTQIKAHSAADEIVKGQYWQHGKGCAVGCCIHSDDHLLMESIYGIPVQIAHLIDNIFEGLPNDIAKQFPVDFVNSLRDGVDLTTVHNQFLAWLLLDPVDGIVIYNDDPAIVQVGELHLRVARGGVVSDAEWKAANAAAYAAANAAANAAAYYAAYYAANAAAKAAAKAAAAEAAAYAAAKAAKAAYAAAAEAAAYAAIRVKQANKLIEILNNIKN